MGDKKYNRRYKMRSLEEKQEKTFEEISETPLEEDYDAGKDSALAHEIVEEKKSFKKELEDLINNHSKENGSDTSDFILAEYLNDCLLIFDKAVKRRREWWGDKEKSGTF